MLCTNKTRVIYFCPNCVNFLPENVLFFYFLGEVAAPPPPAQARASCAYAFGGIFSHVEHLKMWITHGD